MHTFELFSSSVASFVVLDKPRFQGQVVGFFFPIKTCQIKIKINGIDSIHQPQIYQRRYRVHWYTAAAVAAAVEGGMNYKSTAAIIANVA